MNEIASEMEREQTTFEMLSVQLEGIVDQSSARFTKVSMQLIKSQNWLALLMSRNLICLDVVSIYAALSICVFIGQCYNGVSNDSLCLWSMSIVTPRLGIDVLTS